MVTSHAQPRHTPPAWLVWLALWTVYIIWGSTYLAIRVTVETLPPLFAAGVRFLVAGALMYAWLALRGGPNSVRISRRELVAATAVGGALLLGGNGLVMLAERDVPSGLASLIIASVPLWVVVFRATTGERVGKGTRAGVAAGFAGVAMLVLPGDTTDGAALYGLLLLVGAAFSWATGSFLSQRLSLPPNPFLSTAVQMLAGGALLMLGGLARGEASSLALDQFSAASLWALTYLVVAGSFVAFTAYTWLLQNAPISKVATYAYVNPVVAVLLGWAILSESVTPVIGVAAAVIVASVAFIIRRETGPPREPERIEPSPTPVGGEALEPSH